MSPDAAEILAPGGPIASALGNYERRDEQLEMARAVQSAFAETEHLLAEAGTGVGKSFAYLVPAILAVQDGKRVVVSTYTIALQEQLFEKDIPFLREHLRLPFRAVLAKGRRNYLCLRRLEVAGHRADRIFSSQREMNQISGLVEWASTAGDLASRQDVTFAVSDSVWGRVCAEPGSCRGRKCEFYDRCHFQTARSRLRKADLVVTNHAMLFSDAALRFARAPASDTADQPLTPTGSQAELIGPCDLLVLDEAHTLESVASDHFGTSTTSGSVQSVLRELYNPRTDRGLLALSRDKEAVNAVHAAIRAAEAFFDALAGAKPPGVASNGRITRPNAIANTLSPALAGLSSLLSGLRRADRIDLDPESRLELQGYERRLRELSDLVEAIVAQKYPDSAYWRTVVAGSPARQARRGGRYVVLACAPINVAPILKTALFETIDSVVLTSATLTTGRQGAGRFEYIRSRLGLEDARELRLDSPFDFRRQVRLHIETKLGDPNRLDAFLAPACRAIEYYVASSGGRCFVLFTSYRMLQAAAEVLAEFARRQGYTLLVQGGQLPRTAMLEKFRRGHKCVLLGTASFWQGVDVAGEALSNVIIAKLPFSAPDSPLLEARLETIRAGGGDPFRQYQLPEAIIRFKQGFGRLIRSSTDTGLVVCLDHRIVTRPYGRQFIAALPDVEIVRDAAMQQGPDEPI